MSAELIRSIEKLNKQVTAKYSRLLARVTQIEVSQAALSNVDDLVVLIETTSPLSYTANPNHVTPTYTTPTESI